MGENLKGETDQSVTLPTREKKIMHWIESRNDPEAQQLFYDV